MTFRPLYDHQVAALTLLRVSLAGGHQAPMLQAPTGFGKTRLMAEIVNGALAKGKRVLIVVPALLLIKQAIDDLEAEGVDHIGVIQGINDRTDWTAPVQIASVQTLQKRKMPECDLIMIDEAHVFFAFFVEMIAGAKAKRVPVIGLNATPWTKGLGKHFDDLLVAATTEKLIRSGYLSNFRVYAPSHPDLSGVRTLGGDYHEGDLATAMNRPNLIADVVSTWLLRGEGRPTLCFAVNLAHAKQIQNQFIECGVKAGFISAKTTGEEREAIKQQFHDGRLRVVVNVGTLTTGIDWDCRCIILARPTKSESLFVQIIGRGLRNAPPGTPPKDHCLILDHSDTHACLGFVTDIGRDGLDDGKRQKVLKRIKPEALPTECPKCKILRPAKVSLCQVCGFKAERQCKIEVEDGQLVELGRKKKRDASTEDMAFVYGQLLTIAKRYGYAGGWAYHKFKEYFRCPPSAVVSCAPQAEPTAYVLDWVKSRQIAFARRKGRHDVHAP